MYRKNVAGQFVYFVLISAADGSAATGKTVTAKRSIDGAAQASCTGSITEDGNGQYHLAASQADTNGNNIGFLFTASGVVPVSISIVTTAADPTDAVRFGLTALPNAAAGATGGLPLAADNSGRVDVLKVNGTSQTARDLGASVLLSSGTGTGQLDFTAGVVKSNLAQILGTALTETAGLLAGGFKKFFNVAAPASTMDALTLVATATNLTNAPTAGDFTTAMKTSLNAATPAVTVSDKTGFSLSTAGAKAIWDILTSTLTTGGSIGKWILDKLDVILSTRATAAAVWDEDLTTHQTAGSTGKALTDASVAVVPNTIAASVWDRLTSAITTAGSIGKFLQDQLDAAISTRLAASDYTAPSNSAIALIKAKTDNLPGAPAAVSDIPTANANADALLDRADGVETGWTVRQAFRVALASIAGKLSGAATTAVVVRDVTDSKNRITATVDANGNRTAVSYDKS